MKKHNWIPSLFPAQWSELFDIDLVDESRTVGTRCERIFPSSVENVSLIECFCGPSFG